MSQLLYLLLIVCLSVQATPTIKGRANHKAQSCSDAEGAVGTLLGQKGAFANICTLSCDAEQRLSLLEQLMYLREIVPKMLMIHPFVEASKDANAEDNLKKFEQFFGAPDQTVDYHTSKVQFDDAGKKMLNARGYYERVVLQRPAAEVVKQVLTNVMTILGTGGFMVSCTHEPSDTAAEVREGSGADNTLWYTKDLWEWTGDWQKIYLKPNFWYREPWTGSVAKFCMAMQRRSQWGPRWATLFHELTHASSHLMDEGLQNAYGFDRTTAYAGVKPGVAVVNPDNYAWLAHSLFVGVKPKGCFDNSLALSTSSQNTISSLAEAELVPLPVTDSSSETPTPSLSSDSSEPSSLIPDPPTSSTATTAIMLKKLANQDSSLRPL